MAGHHSPDPVLLPAVIGVGWGFLLFMVLFREALSAPTNPKQERATNPLIAVALGLSLVLVPTVFTAFPAAQEWDLGVRVLVIGLWVDVTGIGLSLTATSELRRYAEERRDRRRSDTRRELADVFSRVLAPGWGGIPVSYRFTVYAPDPSGTYMFPLYPRAPSLEDPTIFPIGVGATGLAWHEQAVVVVRGRDVANAKYGLTADQQFYYGRFEVVAAAVIHPPVGPALGVLSAITEDKDYFFAREAGVKVLQAAADTLGWIMPQAIRWLMPASEELGP